LNGIIDIAVSDYPRGGPVNEAAKQISRLFGDGTPDPQVAELLGRQAQISGVADDVSRYLQLEKISFGLSQTLKKQCLEALGLEDSLHLEAISRDFFPPDSKLRSLLNLVFGLQVLPNLQVQSQGRIALSLREASPWSSAPDLT
jgi:hypothetical protein